MKINGFHSISYHEYSIVDILVGVNDNAENEWVNHRLTSLFISMFECLLMYSFTAIPRGMVS